MHLHELRRSTGFQSLLELTLRLTRKTHNHIRAECRLPPQQVPNLLQTVKKSLHPITSPHATEHRVTATLQRRMKLRTQMLTLATGANKIIIHLHRLNTAQTHAPVTGNPIQPLQQMPQSLRTTASRQIVRIHPEMPHVNTAQHDLAVTMVDQCPHFVFNHLRITTAQPRPHRWNDTIRTLQNAAILNLHKGSLTPLEIRNPRRQLSNTKSRQHVRQLTLVLHNLNHVRQCRHRPRIPRGITPHHDRLRARILSRQLANHLTRFRITSVRHRAGIHHTDIRRLTLPSLSIATLQQGLTDQLCLVLVDFAAQSHKAAGAIDIHGRKRRFRQNRKLREIH